MMLFLQRSCRLPIRKYFSLHMRGQPGGPQTCCPPEVGPQLTKIHWIAKLRQHGCCRCSGDTVPSDRSCKGEAIEGVPKVARHISDLGPVEWVEPHKG
jgi:hypothetical protein